MNTLIRRHASGKLAAMKLLGQPHGKSQQTSDHALFFSEYTKMMVNDPSKTVYKQIGQSLKVVERRDVRPNYMKVDNSQLKAELNAIFGERVTSQSKFDRFMRERLSIATPNIISTIMKLGGTKTPQGAVTKKHLLAIGRRIAESALHDKWDYVNVAFCFNGLRTFDINTPGITTLLDALVSVTEKLNKLEGLPNSQNISMAMSGFQNIDFLNYSCVKFIPCIHKMLLRCSNEFTAQSIGSCMLGLKKMTRMTKASTELLKTLTTKIAASDAVLDSQAVSNSLYGLQGMVSNEPEVRELLKVLLPKVLNCREALNAQGIGNSLYGMQEMSCHHPEVAAMVAALAIKARESKSALDAQGFSNAMYGLKSMESGE